MSQLDEFEKETHDPETKPNNVVKETINKIRFINSIKSRKYSSNNLLTFENDTTNKKEDYQIAICQDGKFVATFDSANLRIKILENNDRRPYKNDQNDSGEEICKPIVYFKIKNDFTIHFYNNDFVPHKFDGHDTKDVDNGSTITDDKGNKDDKIRWSFDISNVCKYENRYFIFVAVSRIGDVDMKKTETKEKKGTTVIYRIELIELTEGKKSSYVFNQNTLTDLYHTHGVSGICRFIEMSEKKENSKFDNPDNKCFIIRRFVVLNFHGIHSFNCKDGFNLNKKFDYPNRIRRELDSLDSSEISECMNLLHSYIYNEHFLVEQYKNNVQLLEVYNLAKMKLETITKRVENSNDKLLRRYNRNVFAISKKKLQLCFTRGLQSVKLYFMENGLEITSKKFEEIEKIYSLEFIENDKKLLIIGSSKGSNLILLIWDMYNYGEIETKMMLDDFLTIENLGTRLARTSGNILQVDDEGKVSSILKKVDNELLKSKQKGKNNKKLESPVPNVKSFKGTKLNGSQDMKHTIHFDENTISNFKPIVVEKEPWVLGDYERNSYCLYQNNNGKEIETIQLIVGRSTVQIWHQIQDDSKNKDDLPNKGEPFLEYIWVNGIPATKESEETRLRIKEFKYGSNVGKLNDFSLKVCWYEKVEENEEAIFMDDEDEMMEGDEDIKDMGQNRKVRIKEREEKEYTIRRQDIIEKRNAVRYACKSLEFLNKRIEHLVNYSKEHRYEEMIAYINHIIWRFIKNNPDDYKLLEVRYNVMKNLILGDCDHLIKFILFGDDGDDKKTNKLHIPRSVIWKNKRKFVNNDDTESDEITNVMELAINNCKGRELKDTIIVAYLLEYYSRHAVDYAGWMSTVSKALPLLFKYNYDDYARKLFRKECFANQNYFSALDPYNIIPEEYQERRNNNIKFRAFEVNLKSDEYKWYDVFRKLFIHFKIEMYKFFGELDNNGVEKQTLALRVVPLPEFTINRIPPQDKAKKKILLNIFLFLFIPRWYKISQNEKNKLLSPFSRVVQYENNDDIYDNPATEAIIDFRWQKARTFFFLLFLRFLIFVLCFGIVSWAYLDHSTFLNNTFLVVLIVIFYYLALYFLITEIIQLCYHGPRGYFGDIYNIFDIFSILFPAIVMSLLVKDFHLSNGFGSIEKASQGIIVGISLSVFFLWIETISYLRLIPNIAIYIYYVIIITKTVFPFILFNIVVIVAFAHTMFVLLKETKSIDTKDSTLSGVATDPLTNQELNIHMKADFDPKSSSDNPFSYFPTAVVATYFWLNGDFVQRDEFDFWAVELFSLIASVLLVTILQNMLIAFMGGVYEKAATKGRQALLRFRANQIANYEALYHIHFPPIEQDPKYIYYIGQSKNFETWYESRKNDGPIYKDYEEKSTFTKYIFEEKDYDRFSIWEYDHNIEEEIINIKKMKKEVNYKVENLIKKLNDQKNHNNNETIDKKIEEIEDINNVNVTIEYMIKKLNDSKYPKS
ncbi:hypothetical protein C1645_828188 [Glomus cerebriforme]|uniref:Uncharacterized protein n=1 Tax=Glomus cerebriforme TaxID=658196 RepID=A0A397ST07_9GLOM|nr:hypothetical protein C1645_828188 [Glomus cerebriforme]